MSSRKKPPIAKRLDEKESLTPRSPESTNLDENGIHHLVNKQAAKDIWMFLLVIRFMNALYVQTFFQPDEYFQSLEPAWEMAFGAQSGAWITWVCISPLNDAQFLIATRNGIINFALRYIQLYLQ
jgi:hypothetical protein